MIVTLKMNALPSLKAKLLKKDMIGVTYIHRKKQKLSVTTIQQTLDLFKWTESSAACRTLM